MDYTPYLIIGGILFLVVYFLLKAKFKVPKLDCVTLISGAVKSGKSTLAVRLVNKLYWQRVQRYYLACFFSKLPFLRNVLKEPEMPLVYSNVPLGIPYVELTDELIMREERFAYKSIVYIQECSLFADSMAYKDEYKNDGLRLFNKLIGHELHGGNLIYDTQAVSDCHFAIKRCLNSYLWIHHKTVIPFFLLLWVRELRYSDDNSDVNTFDSDVEDDLRLIIVPKSTWKLFDSYCYSKFTDNLPVSKQVTCLPVPKYSFSKRDPRYKTDHILSIRKGKKRKKESEIYEPVKKS